MPLHHDAVETRKRILGFGDIISFNVTQIYWASLNAPVLLEIGAGDSEVGEQQPALKDLEVSQDFWEQLGDFTTGSLRSI